MSRVIQLSTSWPGFSKINRLFIFGDSYSDVGYDLGLASGKGNHIVPTALNPLGVEWPGSSWNEPDKPNWVGHLLTSYRPGPLYIPMAGEAEQTQAYLTDPLLVHDFARGGDTVDGIQRQIQRLFLPTLSKKPDWAPWSAGSTLFVTWIGINDCAFNDVHDDALNKLFALENDLYDTGARNFLFIDLPPVSRSPAVSGIMVEAVSETFADFNSQLAHRAREFATTHSDSAVFLYSSHEILTKLLDEPVAFGFTPEDCGKRAGGIWFDQLHPTSRVHEVVARDMSDFLTCVEAGAREP